MILQEYESLKVTKCLKLELILLPDVKNDTERIAYVAVMESPSALEIESR